MRSKKGVEISINAIIVAVIALLVLVVLAIIFTGKLGSFSTQAAACATKGGICSHECGTDNYPLAKNFHTVDPTTTCPLSGAGEAQSCCLAITK